MSSLSQKRFQASLTLARDLREIAKDERIRPISHDQKTRYLHAALAAYVAGWDAYLNQLINEFTQKLSSTHDLGYVSIHEIITPLISEKLRKFNTPNWENSRNLLIGCTGYDPIGDWPWRKAQFNRQQTQDFLNGILRARHSFAHGFSIPTFSWTQTPTGRIQLNNQAVHRIERFFIHLVSATDAGLLHHCAQRFPDRVFW